MLVNFVIFLQTIMPLNSCMYHKRALFAKVIMPRMANTVGSQQGERVFTTKY